MPKTGNGRLSELSPQVGERRRGAFQAPAGTAGHPFRTIQKGIDVVSRSTARHGFEGVELVANWLSGGYPASVDADSVQALRRHYGACIKCKRAIDQAWGA